MRFLKRCLVAGLVLCGSGTCLAADPVVTADAMSTAPTLDGSSAEWADVAGATVKVTPAEEGDAKNKTGTVDVTVKAAVNGDNIYFLLQWPDDTKDDSHKTLTWSAQEDGYVEGKDREDRVVLKFEMGGDFTMCKLSGKEYMSDIWHWKAYRSQSAGLAHDKRHVISFEKMPKAKKHPTRDGKEVWVQRPSDKGDKLYKSQRPLDNIGDSVPRYLPNKNAQGSIADIKAASSHDGKGWTVELQRKLNTGHDDDVAFEKGKSYASGVAVFNHAGDNHHSVAAFTVDVK